MIRDIKFPKKKSSASKFLVVWLYGGNSIFFKLAVVLLATQPLTGYMPWFSRNIFQCYFSDLMKFFAKFKQ